MKFKDDVHIFTKKLKVQTIGNRNKKIFFSDFISETPNYSHMSFFRKCSMFHQSIPLKLDSHVPENVCQIKIIPSGVQKKKKKKNRIIFLFGV